MTSNYVSIDPVSRKLVANTAVVGGFNQAREEICITCTSFMTGEVSHSNILIKSIVDCNVPISVAAGVTPEAGLLGTYSYALDWNGGARILYDVAVTETVFGSDYSFLIVNNDPDRTCYPNTYFKCSYVYWQTNKCSSHSYA